MTNTERPIIWLIGITLLLIGGIAYLAWCGAMAVAGFVDWVREDI